MRDKEQGTRNEERGTNNQYPKVSLKGYTSIYPLGQPTTNLRKCWAIYNIRKRDETNIL